MKNKLTAPVAPIAAPGQPTANTKLVSLLALATGAVVMPQTGSADIIYTDLSSGVLVGYDAGGIDSFLFTGLPGAVKFGLGRHQTILSNTLVSLTYKYRTVFAGDLGTQVLGGIQGQAVVINGVPFAVPQPLGAAWDQPGLALDSYCFVGTGGEAGHTPANSYDHQYLAWQFKDSTQGNALRYGWMEIGLNIVNYPTGPNVTLYGYAWDNTGLKPTMGQQPVPEPTSVSLLALGALALGARGLRAWRRDRVAAGQA